MCVKSMSYISLLRNINILLKFLIKYLHETKKALIFAVKF